jgi:uncharacterized membrane protein YeaQ/YmgE (transglycosylase-associated protein family)
MPDVIVKEVAFGCNLRPASALPRSHNRVEVIMHILWTIVIGFVAGVIAKIISPGPNEPAGFIATTLLGIAGAFIATYLGQAIGWYRAEEGAGFIGAVVGALIVLTIWGFMSGRRPVND